MDTVDLAIAKEQLEELVRRAAEGDDVRITDPKYGTVRLTPVQAATTDAERASGTMAPFVPLSNDRVPGRLAGQLKVPARLMEPMTEEELRDWYGDDR